MHNSHENLLYLIDIRLHKKQPAATAFAVLTDRQRYRNDGVFIM